MTVTKNQEFTVTVTAHGDVSPSCPVYVHKKYRKKYFSIKFFSDFKNLSYFESGPVDFRNDVSLKKVKISHKEARKQNSDQYKFSIMIIESTGAFQIKTMNNFKR